MESTAAATIQDTSNIGWGYLQFNLSAGNAGDIKQVVDEMDHMLDLPLHDLTRLHCGID